MPKRLFIDPYKACFADLAPAAQVLLDGGVIAAPTESFYALMAMVDNHAALDKLSEIKTGRQEKANLILLDQAGRVHCYAREVPDEALGLMDSFWPGLMSLLFLAQNGLHASLVGPARTVGLRVEGLPAIRHLVRMVDRGLTGTSANPAGRPPSTTPEMVENYFGDKIDLIVDGGTTPGGAASTIIDVSLGAPRIMRDGGLPLTELIKACPILRF